MKSRDQYLVLVCGAKWINGLEEPMESQQFPI
jgi:hypothetical protein